MAGKTLDEQVPVEVRLAALAWRTPGDLSILFVPYELAAASSNRRRGQHWSKDHAASETASFAAAWAWGMADQPTNREPVLIEALVFRADYLDDDNAWTALKSVRDYLFKGRLALDDHPRYVSLGMMRFVIAPKWAGRNSWVVLLLRRREISHDGTVTGGAEPPTPRPRRRRKPPG